MNLTVSLDPSANVLERAFTRLDKDGLPSIVQRLLFDPASGLYRAFYFDGTTTLVRADVKVTILGNPQAPSDDDWRYVELVAAEKYQHMQALKNSLAFDIESIPDEIHENPQASR